MPQTILLLLVLLAGAAPAAAQPAPHSAWGGPDSPGGLFGGDPREADVDGDRRVTHDEFWLWVRGRTERADANRDRSLTPQELGIRPDDRRRQALFRAADADRSGSLSMEELQMFSGYAFRFHDTDRDGALQRGEARRAGQPRQATTPPAGAQPGAQPAR